MKDKVVKGNITDINKVIETLLSELSAADYINLYAKMRIREHIDIVSRYLNDN